MSKQPEVDSHKLMYHPRRVADWMEKGDGYPIYVEIGLTNICNHKCVFCGLDWARGVNTLNTELLIKRIEEMAKLGVKSVCFSGAGEPLLHKDFAEIVKKTKEMGIDVSFSTNTVMFTKDKAEKVLPYTSWIRFSVDAGTPKTHAKMHGTQEADFEKIINNLRDAARIKKEKKLDVTLGVQFLLMEDNAQELLEFAKLCKEIGVDNLQVKPYSQNPKSINKFSVDYEKYLDLKEKLDALSDDNFKVLFRINRIHSVSSSQDYDTCYGLPFFAIINEKGDVQPCHMYYADQDFSYGNIYNNSFSEIWNSEKRKKAIEKIHELGIHECKKGCRLDLINKYLKRIKNPDLHDNFV